jgi:sporulation protein YlmC with PRC-barrel domain
MILSDLLDHAVRDDEGRHLGHVIDVRMVLDGPPGGPLAAPRLYGLLVSPRRGAVLLGYERTDLDRPALVARALARRHRGTFLVLWEDVADVGDEVVLGPGFRRWSPVLRRP